MDIYQRYLLAADVLFLAAETIPETTKQHVDVADSDVILTYKGSRKRSKVVNAEMADLLRGFTTPHTVAAAIFQYARLTQQDPQLIADTAFPLLLQMQEEGYLVPEKGEMKAPPENQPASGDRFRQYRVKEICQRYENSTVYKVVDAAGTAYALKLFPSPASLLPPADYTNEITILKKLDNTVNPKLVEYGEHHAFFYLVTEWFEGISCEEAAERYRNFISRKNGSALLDLCSTITTAFQHLHSQGVLHGDINPGNVLIAGESFVRIIDYGNAVIAGGPQRTIRGGVDFYYEPELAEALLQDKDAVPVTEKGEQYSLAVLLYRLITGHPYLRFSFEPEKTYRQITTEPPLPFSAFDIDLLPEMEAVFRKALAKNPEHRYDSLAAFAAALQQCRRSVEESRTFFTGGQKPASETFLRFLLRKYGWSQPLIQKGLQLSPTCSLNSGAAGIAYFLYRAACVLEEPVWLDTAEVWVHHALGYENDFDKAFYSADEGITESTVGRRALYHSPTGVHLVQALISASRGDGLSLQKAVQHYLKTSAAACRQLDLALGKAGLLLGSALLLQELKTVDGMDASPLLSFTQEIMQELWQQLDACPSMDNENEVGYYGLAHGWGGLLYATLLWCRTSGQALPKGFSARLEELLRKGRLHKGVMQWPVSGNDKNSWLGWCHGNAGYVFLWSLLFQQFKEEQFLTIATQTGNALFDSRPQTANLCCGLAGETYALLKLYQVTGEKQYLQQAEQMRHRILRNLSSPDLRNHSLYKGEVGIGVLLCEMTRPEMARMPLFA